MITETRDPAILARFAVETGQGYLDFTGAMNPANTYLFGKYGGFLFEWKGPQTYEVHTMITPQGRGRWGFTAARRALAEMASRGATHIWARINPERREVAILAAMTGLREAGTHSLDGVEYRIFNWRA